MLSLDFIPNSGGIAAHVYELSRALVKNGNKVTVITLNRWNEDLIYNHNIEGINIISFLNKEKILGKAISSLFITVMITFVLLSNKKKIDIIHWHSFKGIGLLVMSILKFFSKMKNVWTNHTSYYLEKYDSGNIKGLNKILKIPDWIIAPSKELQIKSWKDVNFKKEKVSYIFNGVDIDKFFPKTKNHKLFEEFCSSNDYKIILCTRRLENKNGVRFLVQAMPQILETIPKLKLLVAGDYQGPSIRSDAELIFRFVKDSRLEDNVVFLGNIANDELIEYYSIADITVLPSLMEAVSISGLESIATGTPIVGSKVGGIPEIIIDEFNGLLTEPENSADIAEKIIDIFNKYDLDVMKLNARNVAVDKFSWNNLSKQVVDVYKEVIYGNQ